MSKFWFVLGGSRCGKSARAETIASEVSAGQPVIFVATCRTGDLDPEMQKRIDLHREARPPTWLTVEDEFNLTDIASRYPGKTILIDCLTLYVSHWMEHDLTSETIIERLDHGLSAFARHDARVIIVSNDVGYGVVPAEGMVRAYRDLVGTANQRVASRADIVEQVIAGIPMRIKPYSPVLD